MGRDPKVASTEKRGGKSSEGYSSQTVETLLVADRFCPDPWCIGLSHATLFRTFETRLDLEDHHRSSVLALYAGLMSRAERALLAKLKSGRKWRGDLHVSMYEPLGMSSTC